MHSPALRTLGPLLLSLAAAIGASLALAHADNSTTRARANQIAGFNRGPILDRNGRVLAQTLGNGGTAVRHYTLDSSASPIGYRDAKGVWHGLERKYDSFLTASSARRDWRTFFLNLTGQSAEGGSVELTLDAAMQRTADEAMGNATGAVVALDPRTGEVLALVSKPYCPPRELATTPGFRRCSSSSGRPLLDRATQQILPPGSSFKIVTLTAALDTGRFTLGSVFAGAEAFGPSPYFDNNDYPSNITRPDLTQVTLAQALAFSDNFVFAHIGLTLGAPTLLKYAHHFYVGRKIPFELPVDRSVVASGDANPSASVLAQSSFGAATDRVTPLQMALIAGAVANHGVLMAPQLVRDLRNASGTVAYRFKPRTLSHVMSSRAARQVTDGMIFVVNHGSGYRAQISGTQVAGKTGTAASGATAPHAWFIAFAPADKPVVAVAVLHEYSGEGFKYAAPIARKVLLTALRERGYRVH